jgi:hypothetical protein
MAWTPAVRSNVIWTQTFFERNDALAAAASAAIGDVVANRWINVLFLNTFFDPVPNLELGIEYAFGVRRIFDSVAASPTNLEGTQHRFNGLARYKFF